MRLTRVALVCLLPISSVICQFAAGATWDTPTLVIPNAGDGLTTKPVLDSVGNAWFVLNPDFYPPASQVCVSNGDSGTWQPCQNPAAGPIAVAPNGVVYTAYIVPIQGSQVLQLFASRYVPGLGWQPAQHIYDIPAQYGGYFQGIQIVTDAAGDGIVSFTIDYQVWAIIYSAAAGTWGQAMQVTPVGALAYEPALKQNASGSAVMLLSTQTKGAQISVYSQLFDPSALTFGTPVAVPGTNLVGVDYNQAPLPMAIDASGNVTATALFQSKFTTALFGLHYQNGVWQTATQLTSWTRDSLYLGDIAVNSAGAVLATADDESYNRVTKSQTNTVFALRFTPGQGWDSEVAAVQQGSTNYLMPLAIAWLGTSGTAVMVCQSSVGLVDLISAPGAAWSTGPPIASQPQDYAAKLITGPNGDVLMIYLSQSGTYGLYSTWLRP